MIMDEKLVLKNRLKEVRAEKGFSQQQLADQAGLNRSQIQKLERGEINPANMAAINYIRLCRVLKLDPMCLDK